ncbi:MAG: S-methyl-5-thioribose-1-phosphate isomerase [Spirochaetales bacterium]|nr:S-methyl-5-thioribose-1-phosphate isomerase [Spirochaetales bacterium]
MRSFLPIEGMAIRWQSQLEILDQRELPLREDWIRIDSPADMVVAIKELAIRGAPLIGVGAALALAQEAQQNFDTLRLSSMAQDLRQARPTAVNLMNAMDRLLTTLASGADQQTFLNAAFSIYREDIELCEQIAAHGANLLAGKSRLLTHCNTGSLATAGVGTALGIIRAAHKKLPCHIYVDETRPLLQGARLTAYELHKDGIPATLICDNMAASLMRAGEIQAILVGADRIARNGDFANKTGTYSLAVLAQYHNIPFIVAAPRTTLDLACPDGAAIPIEERRAAEIHGVDSGSYRLRWSPAIPVYNPAFDVTPADLVSALVLDTGVYTREDLLSGRLSQIR